MSKANERQPGGDHYKSEYEHWDFIEEHGIGYLEAATTKYISRWRKKGGQLDLEKALHYIDKLIELHETRFRLPRGVAPVESVIRFCLANKIDVAETVVVKLLAQWSCRIDLLEAKGIIEALLSDCIGEACRPDFLDHEDEC